MELKLLVAFKSNCVAYLLIVPYGIETKVELRNQVFVRLLIVPYGIETDFHTFKYIRAEIF